MCKIADYSALQRRKLNASKGPAVQATRIQTCRDTYKLKMQEAIDAQTNLSVIEGMVSNIIVDNEILRGVVMSDGSKVFAKTVVLTTGTFLGGKIHVGDKSFSAGRLGDNA